MTNTIDLAVIPGDGIGPEVIAEAVKVLKKATQVAATEATVFLQGESGTGKEVIARFIHGASGRRKGPFVVLRLLRTSRKSKSASYSIHTQPAA